MTPCPTLESFRADRRSSMEAAGVDPKGAFVIAAHACFNAEEDPNEDCKRQSS
ncbi:hypothetical protein SynA1562_00969 [Synechococcus sp. A15-62]|nr:hypothetical protein SynA1562_00969 [Synechococcus sp. A15-62]